MRRESEAGAPGRERRSERSPVEGRPFGAPRGARGLAPPAQSPWTATHRRAARSLHSAPSGFRVPAEGGGGGASHLPAGPGEKGSPCHRGSPAAHLASRSQPLPAPLPAPSRLPPPSGGAKFLGAGTRSRQGCASRGRRREGHSLDSFPPTCCPGPFQGGGGGCVGRAAARGQRRVAGSAEPRRLPGPPCSSSSAASWGD